MEYRRDSGRGRGGFGGRGRRGGDRGAMHGSVNIPSLDEFSVGTAARPTETMDIRKEEEEFILLRQSENLRPEIKAIGAAPMPARPSYGQEGQKINVQANHFPLDISLREVFHFDVEIFLVPFKPSEGMTEKAAPKRLNRIVMEALAMQQGWKRAWAYDGIKSLFMPDDSLPRNRHDYQVQFLEPGSKEQTARVQLKGVGVISIEQLKEWVSGRRMSNEQPQEAIHALDVALRQAKFHEPGCYQVGSGFYFPNSRGAVSSLGPGVELWKGIFQSVRPADGGLSLNVDVAHAAVFESILIPQLISAILRIPEGCLGRLDRIQYKQIKGLLMLKKVQAVHLGEAVKTIRNITKDSAEQLTFKMPETISVAEYYDQKKGKRLRHPEWPCADVGTLNSPAWIPIELLKLVPGQRAATLDSNQQREMIRQTATRPDKRREAIDRVVNEHARISEEPTARAFGARIERSMMTVPARILEAPAVLYGSRRSSSEATRLQPNRGSWDLRDVVFYKAAELPSYGIACMTRESGRLERDLEDFVNEQLNQLQQYGLKTPHRRGLPTVAFVTDHPGNAVYEAFKYGREFFGTPPTLIFVLLPTTDTETYRAVKRASDSFLGIPSQCFVLSKAGVGQDTPFGKKMQYMGNLAMKINSKLGGINQMVDTRLEWREPYILLGADVTHPPPGSEEPSVAAVVASLDNYQARFAARVMPQSSRTEVILGIGEMVRDLIKSYYRATKKIPNRIIMYRDGVSEGQFKIVKAKEITAILQACGDFFPPVVPGRSRYEPQLTYIVVQKRHHTRLWPESRAADKNGNPQPGTVVDRKIVRPVEFSFFLNSHAAIQGTSSPSLYHVLLDQNRFGMDVLQRFTYNLCYQYQRATKAVSIVPPAYYADLAAERGRCMIAALLGSSESDGAAKKGNVKIEWAKIHKDLDRVFFFI